MTPVRISFAKSQFLDLAEQSDYTFPHFIQRLVLPIVAFDGRRTRPLGTGFLIGPHLLVTARHVIEQEVQRAMSGAASLAALYITDQPLPEQDGPWGGPLAVRNLSMASGRKEHDLALLTIDFPYLPNAEAARPNALGLKLTAPTVGSSVLVLGYSEMAGGDVVVTDGTTTLPHTQRVRASQGRIAELHVPRRDSATLSFPVFRSDYVSPHGMSGGPVIGEDGRVVGVVCSSFDHGTEEDATSYASLVAPLLGLSANPTMVDPPEFMTVWDLLERRVIGGDGSHRLYPRPVSGHQ